MFDYKPKRLTLFMGHYGSGKTELALNFAYELKRQGKEVVIADLDIVNPYFRTKDSQEELEKKGIKLIVSKYANSNVDLPSINSETYSLIENHDVYGVLDIGGDDRGALALGRFADEIKNENNYDSFLVVNRARPLTRTVNEVIEVAREIENICNIKFTGVINNSNIGNDTTKEYVYDSISWAQEVADRLSLCLLFTSSMRRLDIKETFPMDLRRYEWQN